MALSKLTTDLNIISPLDTEPNDVGGLTAAQLKAKFDEGTNDIKTYINNTLTTEADDTLATKAEVQGIALGQIPDGTITEAKLVSALVTLINGAAQTSSLIDSGISLSDAVKTALGLSGTKYVSDALILIKSLISANTTLANSKAGITWGSYTGTGTYGSDNPNSATSPFAPKVMFIKERAGDEGLGIVIFPSLTKDYTTGMVTMLRGTSVTACAAKKSEDGLTVSWFSSVDQYVQFNSSGAIYDIIYIG